MNTYIGKLGKLSIPLLALGIVGGVAYASNSVPTSTTQATTQTSVQKETPKSTVDDAKDTEQSDAKEQQSLQAKATITPEQAKAAAVAKVGGTASSATLSDEEHSLTYEVVVGTQQIKVDAATGKVLEVDVNDPEEAEGSDQGQD